MSLQNSNDPDTFYSSFTSFISSNAETFFTTLDHFTATLMANNLGRQVTLRFSDTKRTKHHSHSKNSVLDQK